ncbi:3,4-dihydroxy-2-butanone 4-phosphate synthase [Viridothelium virens]|uniref:3,4-dihydroxy-2-butanone 4-phosphate synthase n=1 Tax=Viridothelium virens TaxID=1048519 RepID=A0A6A6H7I1_VIRVR|nr:3,4-dihydroxy-2-butanone 4-phosphate synthase [Viridothelium virens]
MHSHKLVPDDQVNGLHDLAQKHKFDTIEDTIASFASGNFVIVLDSPSRENEGDLIIAASALTPAKAGFLIRHTSGYLCAPLPASRCDALGLPPMVEAHANADPNRTAYTLTVDAVHPDVTTGISAHDRSLTCRMLADPTSTPDSFRRPGHVVPLRAREGGVRERQGHTEAAVELCRLARVEQAAVICEMVRDGEEVEGRAERDGAGMMRRDECLAFGERWGLRVCTIEDLVRYVEEKEGKLEIVGGTC